MALPIGPSYEPYDEARDPEEEILELAANLEVPEGYRVQVIDGRIIVTRPADGDHAVALTALMKILLLAGVEEEGFHVVQNAGIYLRPKWRPPQHRAIRPRREGPDPRPAALRDRGRGTSSELRGSAERGGRRGAQKVAAEANT